MTTSRLFRIPIRIFALAFLVMPPVAGHEGKAIAPHDLAGAWVFAPGILVPLALSAWLYRRGAHPGDGITRRESRLYWLGWVSLSLALVSPLHAAGEALFSAHMLQHEIVMVVSAPLLVLGRPLIRFLWAVPRAWRRPIGLAAISPLTRPASAGLLHGSAIWIWHYPPLFDATLGNDWIHSAQHVSFLVTALLFWWSVFQCPPGAALLNLLIATIHTGVLGALLTFSGSALYPAYAHASIGWSVAPLVDQQLGGLIMWIPGGLTYLAAGMWIASRSLVPARA